MRQIQMLVTASSGGEEYTEGETYDVVNVLAESFAEHGYARFTDPDEQEAFDARFPEAVAKRDADVGAGADEGSV